jgi:chemotaxis protein CheD
MLPLWNGQGLASPKYGNIAIEKLINKMKYLGCKEENLVAKVFGGGRIINTTYETDSIGDRNVEIALDMLRQRGIKIVKQSTGGERGRKIMLLTHSFDVYHKFIEKTKT